MTALTRDRDTDYRSGSQATYPAGVDTLYAGALATLSAGYAVAAQDAAGHRFAGVVKDQVVCTVAGDKDVVVLRDGEFLLNFSGTATQADVGKSVYVTDDQTVQLAQPGTGNVYCGEITGIEDSGASVWVDIEPATRAQQGHLVTLHGDITAATTTSGGDAISLPNPFGERAIILDVIPDVTSEATGAATLDVGVAADGTTSSDTLIDGVDVGSAAIIANNIDNKGTNGGRGKAWGSTQYITATPSATLAGLVGTYYVTCFVPTARG